MELEEGSEYDLTSTGVDGRIFFERVKDWLKDVVVMPDINEKTGFPFLRRGKAKEAVKSEIDNRSEVSTRMLEGMLHLLAVDILLAMRQLTFLAFAQVGSVAVDESIYWEVTNIENSMLRGDNEKVKPVKGELSAETRLRKKEYGKWRGSEMWKGAIRFYEKSEYVRGNRWSDERTEEFLLREAAMQPYWAELRALWRKREVNIVVKKEEEKD